MLKHEVLPISPLWYHRGQWCFYPPRIVYQTHSGLLAEPFSRFFIVALDSEELKKKCRTGGNLLDSEAPGQYRELCHDWCSRALFWHFHAITACLKHPSINFLSPPPLASCSQSHRSAGPSPSGLPRVEAGLQPYSKQTTIHTNSNALNVSGQSDLRVFEGSSGL